MALICHSRCFHQIQNPAHSLDRTGRFSIGSECVFESLKDFPRITGAGQHNLQNAFHSRFVDTRNFSDLIAECIGSDLVQFVQQSQELDLPSGRQPRQTTKSTEDATVIDPDAVAGNSQFLHHCGSDHQHLGIGGRSIGSHQVHVALHELAEATSGGLLCSPDRSDLVPAEWHGDLTVLGENTGQRHGQIVA